MSSKSTISILAIPFPAQGHLNPMVQFCTILATKGLKVTLILTEKASKSIQSPTTTIEVVLIPDECDDNVSQKNVETIFGELRASVSKGLPGVVEKQRSYGRNPKIVLYDSIMPWVMDLAKEFGLQSATLFTQSCSVGAIFYHVLKRDLEIPLENSSSPNATDAVITLPSMPIMGINDLPCLFYFKDAAQFIISILTDQLSNIEQVDWIFFNTFDKLEHQILRWMKSKWPLQTIGPLIPSMYTKENNNGEDYRMNLFKPDSQTCINWLDMKAYNSVLYVSFGSAANLTEEQMAEIAIALFQSHQYFLWVVRESEENKLPKDFKSKVSEKGIIVKWCPQLRVLAHRTIACFITHCGWNSTLEALTFGVPMIAMPQWADQQMNAKFVVDVWETGVRPKANEEGIVTNEKIQVCIKEVMEEEKGKELRINAIKWKGLANEALLEDGSSHCNIENFISQVSSM